MSELKETRIDLGLSLREAGELCRLSYQTIRRVEEGLNHPRPDTQDQLIGGYREYALKRSVHYTKMASKLA